MTTHWTATSVDDFVHRLSFDFITQLAKRLESSPINRTEFAQKLDVSKGRVSQILNNPSNLTLNKAVKYARALGMKISVIAYDDQDPENENGPINSEIFSICWEKAGKPRTFGEARAFQSASSTGDALIIPNRKNHKMSVPPQYAITHSDADHFNTLVVAVFKNAIFESDDIAITEAQPERRHKIA